jgi:hypothetical protein
MPLPLETIRERLQALLFQAVWAIGTVFSDSFLAAGPAEWTVSSKDRDGGSVSSRKWFGPALLRLLPELGPPVCHDGPNLLGHILNREAPEIYHLREQDQRESGTRETIRGYELITVAMEALQN